MCGIFGYVGKKSSAAQMVLEGLKTLEYRGYDSWGIAVKSGDAIVIDKHIGKIGHAETKLPSSTIGIGHTRWATHGGVTVENAHPHSDCTKQIAVLHNGIIENYQELKAVLIEKGHIFKSETDTEVVPHLIEDFLKDNSFATAVRLAFKELQGMNAIVTMYAPSKQIIAAKNGSPLVVGVGEDGYYLASDAAGIVKHTKQIIFMEDNQMVILDDQLQLLSLPSGAQITPEIKEIDWEFEETEMGEFPHFFLKEIYDQPKVLENIALNGTKGAQNLADNIQNASGTFMVACGSAAHAAQAGVYLYSKLVKKHINFAIGSEFNYLEDYLTDQSLIVPISQSGESVDVIEPVTAAKKKGSKVFAIVNVQGSTLFRMADEKVLLTAGTEKSVVATKSYIAMLAVLILSAFAGAERTVEGQELLHKAASNIRKMLVPEYIEKIKELSNKLKKKEHLYVLGRGLSYATALETTLKLKESSYIHAEGFAGGELKHGVMALIEKGTPCIIIAPNDETYDEIISNTQEVKARGAFVIGVGPRDNEVFDFFLKTDDLEEATMIPQVVVAQLLGYYLALAKGNPDPDKPRNLAKSVTVK